MGASSVTGVGMGMSGGLQKKANHCSCACACKKDCETEPVAPRKRGCVTSYNASSGTSYVASSGGTSIKVC
jgi:hypothetical protein